MFSASSKTSVAEQGRLRALRLSLNTPVVAIPELPVGPASAGIALRDGPRGQSLCLAVRSVRTGQLVRFMPDEDWDESGGRRLGIDAALSFAEGMGFLFDEDLMCSSEAGESERRWAELLVFEAPAASDEEAAGVPSPVLSKFRLRPPRLPAAEPSTARRGEVWLRLLSRF
jgi:hypothetical protein